MIRQTENHLLMEFNLINMNKRSIDLIQGSSLYSNPFVQAPDYPNNFNRYTYALNNPLKFTDPSGFINENVSDEDEDNTYLGQFMRQYAHEGGTFLYRGEYIYYDSFTDAFYSGSSGSIVGRAPSGGSSYLGSNTHTDTKGVYYWMSAGYYSSATVGIMNFKVYTYPYGPAPSYTHQFSSASNRGSRIKEWWNTHWSSKIIPDVIYGNFTIGSALYKNPGSTTMGFAFPIRGKQAFKLYTYSVYNEQKGVHAGIGLNLGYSSYIGDTRNFDFIKLMDQSASGWEADLLLGFSSSISTQDMFSGVLYTYGVGIGSGFGLSYNQPTITVIRPTFK